MTLSRRTLLAAAAAAPLGLGACAGRVTQPGDLSRLRIMAPASPGGGWDSTSRLLLQRVMQRTGLTRNVQVYNVEGAGGTIGLGQLSRQTDDALLMMMGLVMVGAVETNKSPIKVTDVTPIARLLGEPEIIVVPPDSPHDDLRSFVAAWKDDPRGNPIAGGSAGGTDQILAGLLAEAGGVDTSQLNYIAYSGGGESLAALLGSKVAAGISGVGEYGPLVQEGKLKGLAVSGDQPSARAPGVPTITEAGYDLVVSNWRGLLARPGMSEQATADLIGLVVAAHDKPEWADVLNRQGWEDQFITGADYGRFLVEEEQRVQQILAEIGLT